MVSDSIKQFVLRNHQKFLALFFCHQESTPNSLKCSMILLKTCNWDKDAVIKIARELLNDIHSVFLLTSFILPKRICQSFVFQ
jgi:hypothetical protein